MNILFVIEVKIIVLIEWPYRPRNVLTIESKWLSYFRHKVQLL